MLPNMLKIRRFQPITALLKPTSDKWVIHIRDIQTPHPTGSSRLNAGMMKPYDPPHASASRLASVIHMIVGDGVLLTKEGVKKKRGCQKETRFPRMGSLSAVISNACMTMCCPGVTRNHRDTSITATDLLLSTTSAKRRQAKLFPDRDRLA